MIDFFYEIQGDPVVTGIDTSYKNNRWKGWSESFDHYEPSMDVMLFIGLHILLTRGTVKNLDQVRLLKS